MQVQLKTYQAKCNKCVDGVFYTLRGMPFGKCFACRGLGYFKFKAKPPVIEAPAVENNNHLSNAEFFAAAYPKEWTWLNAKKQESRFAFSLICAIDKYGHLTPKQLAVCTTEAGKMIDLQIAQANHAKAQMLNEIAQLNKQLAGEPKIETDKLMEAFDKAKEKGIKKPKLRFDGFALYPALPTGINAGAVYAKDKNNGYLGKIKGGKFHKSFNCDDAKAEKIVAVMQDPVAMSVAYGKKFGVCGCCGRTLSDPESVKLGIGPICYAKFFG